MRLAAVRLRSSAVEQLPLFRTPRWVARHETSRGTRFTDLPIRSIINTPQQTKMGFWSINPYVGCEFGCTYCYARPTHRYLIERGLSGGQLESTALAADDAELFERNVFVKQKVGPVLRQTLRTARIGSGQIVIGTATDPYQPAEQAFGVTRAILEELARYSGLDVGIITKSPLIVRDITVLRELRRRSRVTIHISLISTDRHVIRQFEARSPAPEARLRALGRLRAENLEAGLIVAPVLPGITDTRSALAALMESARARDARFVQVVPLRMYGEFRARYLAVLRDAYPDLIPRYENAFSTRRHVPANYRRALKRRVHDLRQQFEIPDTPGSRT